MTHSAILDTIASFTDKRYPNSEVYLFGSRTKKTSKPDSDWDILLLLDQETVDPETEKSIMDDFYELELKTGTIISPLIYSKKHWNKTRPATRLFKQIQKEGIRLK
jgi:predicted nucleotidyltransferase